MRRGILRAVVAAAALLLVAPASALAQSTGGSFGGGSFGGSGSGSSSYGGSSSGGSESSSGSSSSSSSSSSGSSYHGGSSGSGYGDDSATANGGGCGVSPGFAVAFALLFAFYLVVNPSKKRGFTRGQAAAAEPGKLDVSALRLGIDWRARQAVQARLSELARAGQTDSPAQLAELLRETVVLLQASRLSWLYAHVANHQPMSPAEAERAFRDLASRARAEFRDELIRNADGALSARDTPDLQAHPHEGAGVVVVTLIVAAKRPIVDTLASAGVEFLDVLLEDLRAVAASGALAALEVVWSPAAEDDRMSTAELEQHYPELEKLDEKAIVGRVFCAHCSGPFPMELLACPHCGAPVSKATRTPRA